MTFAKRKNIVFSTLTRYNRVSAGKRTLANHPTRFLSEKTLDPESGYLSETEHKHKHCNRKTSERRGMRKISLKMGWLLGYLTVQRTGALCERNVSIVPYSLGDLSRSSPTRQRFVRDTGVQSHVVFGRYF